MTKLNLDGVKTFLEKEGDCTIRLLNRNLSNPEKYIFGVIWFDGNKDTWTVRFLQKNWAVKYENGMKKFSDAKESLIKETQTYLDNGYKITALISGFNTPWLNRKRTRK
jgi:hypothetical protein